MFFFFIINTYILTQFKWRINRSIALSMYDDVMYSRNEIEWNLVIFLSFPLPLYEFRALNALFAYRHRLNSDSYTLKRAFPAISVCFTCPSPGDKTATARFVARGALTVC